MNKTLTFLLAMMVVAVSLQRAPAQVPGIIQYQGRVTVAGTNFTGTGQFKFAIIEGILTGAPVWSSSDLSGSGEPKHPVPLTVTDGLFIAGLGDPSLTNMAPVPASIFGYSDLRLRIWFSDGGSPFAALSPDQRITSVGYAMMAAGVSDGAVTGVKIAPEAVTQAHLASNSVAGIHLLNQSITGAKVVPNSLTSTQIADTISFQQVDLGGPLWNGVLNLWGAGVGEVRGQLTGDGAGSHLQLHFADNTTGAVLSARSPGGRLLLFDAATREVARLGTSGAGGYLFLNQTTGTTGAFLDGQGPAGGGELRLANAAGTETTVEIIGAESAGTGAELRLRRANGTATVVIDAENDGAGNPRVDLYTGAGTNTMALLPGGGDASVGGGGLVRLGVLNGNNLGLDDNEIIARTNGAAAPLYLNNVSGGVVHTTRLAVNTATPATGYAVSVNGRVICEELVVQDSADWPDYVFASDYRLRPLEEVEASIAKHRHLPGVPSAKMIGDNGIPLGRIQRQMMEKIEELTLYAIEQNKRLKAQAAEMDALRARLDAAK